MNQAEERCERCGMQVMLSLSVPDHATGGQAEMFHCKECGHKTWRPLPSRTAQQDDDKDKQ